MKLCRHLPLALLAFVAALPLACGSKPAANANAGFSLGGTDAGTAPPACAPGQPCPPPASNCAPGQPCPPPATSAAPLGSVYTTDPNQLAALLAAAAAAGSAWLQPMGGGDPVEVGVRAAAAKYASGMTAEGQMAKGQLAEGGHIQFLVNMEPNKCYTIVGYGAVADLDLNLLAPPLYNMLAGQDGMAGPTAVIGAQPKPMCPIAPITVPYKVDVFAKKGGGAVGAQVYSKPK